MKRVILPVAAVAAFALSASSFAVENNGAASNAALASEVSQLSAETKKLEHEVAVLKNKHTHKNKHHAVTAKKKTVPHDALAEGQTGPASSSDYPWKHFVTVTTTPFLDKAPEYNGSDLLVNFPTMNQDLALLKHRQAVVNQLAARGYHIDRPILQLSGEVAGQLFSNGGFGTKATDGVSLSDAELDMNAIASSWANAFMSMEYNGAPVSTGNRAPNASIYLSRGFVTIGNLDVTPVYFTGGLMYVPYGSYNNSMVSTPLTQSMDRILSPTALLGVSFANGLYGSAYGFSGSRTSGASAILKQAGFNAGFKHTFATDGNYDFGAGWVSNVADSQGQQNNGVATTGGQFGGFAVSQPGTTVSNNNLVHNVGGFDVHGVVGKGPVSVIGEYLGADERYSPLDLTYNSAGAMPRAMHAEVDYLLPWFAKKYGTTLGLSYGRTWQSLALNLPQDKYAAFVNTSIWRETTESLEYNYQQDYATTATALGRGATTVIQGTGKHSNSVIAQFGVYF